METVKYVLGVKIYQDLRALSHIVLDDLFCLYYGTMGLLIPILKFPENISTPHLYSYYIHIH